MRLSTRADPGALPGHALRGALARTVRRTWLRHLMLCASAAMVALSSGMAAGLVPEGAALGLLACVVVIWRGRPARTRQAAARRVEQTVRCSNVVITAEELIRHPDRAATWVRLQVLNEADDIAAAVPVRTIAPLMHSAALMIGAAALLAAMWAGLGTRTWQSMRSGLTALNNAGTVTASAPLHVVVTVTAPAYTAKPPRELSDPERIEALDGSHLRIAMSGGNSRWRVRVPGGPLPSSLVGSETVAETRVTESGFLAIEVERGESSERRLIPLVVLPDRAPDVRIAIPGRDLIVPDASGGIEIEASASDDMGLTALELRYTRVSGEGEQFEFEEGTLPVSVARESSVAWAARGRLSLASLKLEPGDAVVYRAVARDARPGDAGLATSDTFFVEIAGPGQVALEGFEMPPDQGRYALSQQMIVLKIQRLRARERAMAAAALAEEAASIAAEQRAVRANFIVLMGGHVENEEQEAVERPSAEEGRLQNTAREEIGAAVTHMTHAEHALAIPDTASALAAAKAAVEALQRALGRNRYILRTIPSGSRVDPSRRLTGDLSAASDWRREVDAPAIDRDTRAARDLLWQLLTIAAAARAGRADPATFSGLAEQALAIDPADALWQDVARRLQQVPAGGEISAARLSDAIAPVVVRVRRGARMPAQPGTDAPTRLLGAWAGEAAK